MKVGTRSVLYGAHCFLVHPWFVAWAWWRLYGFPFDPRLWFAFFLHDIGYIGKPNMDGEEGEQHPHLGANVMQWLFGAKWYKFTLYHSRFLAKRDGRQYTKLCVADKLAIVLTPSWIYVPMARATGEIREYRSKAEQMNPGSDAVTAKTDWEWHAGIKPYVQAWVDEHKDLREDTWTKARSLRASIESSELPQSSA